MDISFANIYLKFAQDEDESVRYCAACSIHEAFKIIDDDEDTSSLRQCFLSFILDPSRDIMKKMNENLAVIVMKFGNAHTVENFKDRTPYVDSSDDNGSKETSPRSR